MLLEVLQRRAGLSSSSDYTSYQRYATRRLKKLRHRFGLVSKSTKEYTPKPVTAEHWIVPVLEAERCWAAAMSQRAAIDADAQQVSSSLLRSKLAKAVRYATQACQLAGKSLEFQTYVALLAGEAALEKQNFNSVAFHFAKLRIGICCLNTANSEVYSDLLRTVVDPALRIALAKEQIDVQGDLNQVAVPIVQVQFPEFYTLVSESNAGILDAQKASEKVGRIQFRHHEAEVRYESLAEPILALKTQEAQLSPNESNPEVLDATLTLWDQLTSRAHALQAEISDAGQDREQDLDIIATYAEFHLLFRRIQRDSLVAQRERGKPNAVRLYDVLQQTCDSMAELPGVNNDDELVDGIEKMKLYFAVHRALALAELYPKGSLESLALANLGYKKIRSADSEVLSGLPITSQDLQKFRDSVKQFVVKTHALTVIHQEIQHRSKVLGSVASDVAFVQTQDKEIADYKGERLDVVGVKPVFYDIAYNYVLAEESEPEKKGIFGLFK